MTVHTRTAGHDDAVKFNPVVNQFAKAVNATTPLTTKADPMINTSLDIIFRAFTSIKDRLQTYTKTQLYLGALLLAMASFGIGMSLLIPAIIFFPITIMLGIGAVIAFCSVAPIVMIAAWFLLCSEPVQTQIVDPLVKKFSESEKFQKLIYSKKVVQKTE